MGIRRTSLLVLLSASISTTLTITLLGQKKSPETELALGIGGISAGGDGSGGGGGGTGFFQLESSRSAQLSPSMSTGLPAEEDQLGSPLDREDQVLCDSDATKPYHPSQLTTSRGFVKERVTNGRHKSRWRRSTSSSPSKQKEEEENPAAVSTVLPVGHKNNSSTFRTSRSRLLSLVRQANDSRAINYGQLKKILQNRVVTLSPPILGVKMPANHLQDYHSHASHLDSKSVLSSIIPNKLHSLKQTISPVVEELPTSKKVNIKERTPVLNFQQQSQILNLTASLVHLLKMVYTDRKSPNRTKLKWQSDPPSPPPETTTYILSQPIHGDDTVDPADRYSRNFRPSYGPGSGFISTNGYGNPFSHQHPNYDYSDQNQNDDSYHDYYSSNEHMVHPTSWSEPGPPYHPSPSPSAYQDSPMYPWYPTTRPHINLRPPPPNPPYKTQMISPPKPSYPPPTMIPPPKQAYPPPTMMTPPKPAFQPPPFQQLPEPLPFHPEDYSLYYVDPERYPSANGQLTSESVISQIKTWLYKTMVNVPNSVLTSLMVGGVIFIASTACILFWPDMFGPPNSPFDTFDLDAPFFDRKMDMDYSSEAPDTSGYVKRMDLALPDSRTVRTTSTSTTTSTTTTSTTTTSTTTTTPVPNIFPNVFSFPFKHRPDSMLPTINLLPVSLHTFLNKGVLDEMAAVAQDDGGRSGEKTRRQKILNEDEHHLFPT